MRERTHEGIVRDLSEKLGLPETAVDAILVSFFDELGHQLKAERTMEVPDLGIFAVATRPARTVNHPRTGKPVHLPAKDTVVFRSGIRLRNRIQVPEEIRNLLAKPEKATAAAEKASPSPPEEDSRDRQHERDERHAQAERVRTERLAQTLFGPEPEPVSAEPVATEEPHVSAPEQVEAPIQEPEEVLEPAREPEPTGAREQPPQATLLPPRPIGSYSIKEPEPTPVEDEEISPEETNAAPTSFLRGNPSQSRVTVEPPVPEPPRVTPAHPPNVAKVHAPVEQENQDGARVLCVASGKGGTGKSFTVCNLAVSLAKMGKRVIVLDADLGLANLHLLLGINPRYNLSHVLGGEVSMVDIMEEGPGGVRLISGGSGVIRLANIREGELLRFVSGLAELEAHADIIIIDTAAGISPRTVSFLTASREILLVTTPDITAMTDAYAILKSIAHSGRSHQTVSLLVNQSSSKAEADAVYRRLSGVTRKFLGRDLHSAGFIHDDVAVTRAVALRTPLVIAEPSSKAAHGIAKLAETIKDSRLPHQNPRRYADRLRGILVNQAM